MIASRPTPSFPTVATRSAHRGPKHANKDEVLAFKASEGDAKMALADFFGDAAIKKINSFGKIIFHAMGDSGVNTAEQESVARAMSRDINNQDHEQGPSFMLHLGDIIYGPNKEASYADRFYRMYDEYNRLIFAIPGNHDGEVLPNTDPATLSAFSTNFCAPRGEQPPMAKQFGILMPNQPGPYWHLEAPFVDIVALYSNAGENFGVISGPVVGDGQKIWLQERLTAIAAARATNDATKKRSAALILAVHHPPYARGFHESGFGHPGNPEMLKDIDAACAAAHILPDAVLAGHTHNYQRYMRTQTVNGKEWTIPYIIVGTGGISTQKTPAPTGVRKDDVLYASALQENGYLTVTVSQKQLTLAFTGADDTHRDLHEQITIDLTLHTQV
jgi:predicted phosphodiesterase